MSVQWTGFEELRRQMASLPAVVQARATTIVRAIATSAESEIRGLWPTGPGSRRYGPGGNLKRGLRTRELSGVRARVQATAPHTHLVEQGTRIRRTRDGANRGAMPALSPPVWGPTIAKWRGRMRRALVDMVSGVTGARVE